VNKPRYPRSSCCVPFCRRTSTLFSGEWVCGAHWRLVDRGLKRFRTKRLKQIGRALETAEALVAVAQADLAGGGPEAAVWAAAHRACNAHRRWRRTDRATWRRMKHQAITRAAELPL